MIALRISSSPEGDIETGRSYGCGAHGDDDQAHAGLSCYRLDEPVDRDSVELAVEKLDRALGVVGAGRGGERWLLVIRGRHAGVGPDGEDLCADARLVVSFACSSITSVEHAIELIGVA